MHLRQIRMCKHYTQVYLGSRCSNLCSLWITSLGEQGVELPGKYLLSPSKVWPHSHPQGEIGVLQDVGGVVDNVFLFDAHWQDLETKEQMNIFCKLGHYLKLRIAGLLLVPHLSLLVDPDDSRGGFVRSSHKDGFCADSVHVDTHSRLQVVQVNVTVLCDQIYDTVLVTNLRRTRGRENISIQQST